MSTVGNAGHTLDTLSPEFRLAVACCIWPPGPLRAERIAAALSPSIDWPLFTRVVKRQRIASLVHHGLGSNDAHVPQEARASLHAQAAKAAQQALAFAGETLRLTGLLQAAGIPAACIKGTALGLLAFGNIALRQSRDIDLLIAPADALHADEILTGAGYTRSMPIGPHTAEQKRAWMRFRKHFEYIHPVTHTQVELHWRLFDNARLVDPLSTRPGATYSSWTAVPLAGSQSLLTLARQDLLLYLCVHGANHMWFRLKWIADIGALLATSDRAEVEQLRADAAEAGATRAVAQALSLAWTLFATPVAAPTKDATAGSLVRSALQAMTSSDAATELEHVPFGTSRVAFARYRLRMDPRFWLQEARAGLLDERDRERSGLPPSLTFLLPLLRLPLWIARRTAGHGRSNR